jgi:uncharacterized protein (TIGR02147 family)
MKPHQILKKYFLRKQKANPKYSLRAFARDLKVSAPFASRLFLGTQEIPLKRLGQIAKVLDMDILDLKDLKNAIAKEFLNTLGLSSKDFVEPPKQVLSTFEDKAMTLKEMSVLSPWFNIAILELVTCEDFKSDAAWMAKRLGIRPDQAETSKTYLIRQGYLKEVRGVLQKTDRHLRLPTKNSLDIVKRYHKSMMDLAAKEMFRNGDSRSFENRLITSTSIAVNPANIPLAKERLAEVQLEVSELLREGPCTEVYDLTLVLFPLTHSR